jgi:ABC-2 type transport system permease protein
MRAIRFLVRKEFLQIVRDRATMAQLLFIPFIQLLVLANAATFAIRDTRVVIVDQDGTTTSRALAARLEGGRQFHVERVTASALDAERDLVGRRASMIVHIPPRFEQRLVRDRAAPIQLSVNAEEGAVAGLITGYAQRILADFARDRAATFPVALREIGDGAATDVATMTVGVARPGSLDVQPRLWFNVTRNYKHYMVPAILVSLVTIIGTLVTAQNIARERELGTLEQINVTPLRRIDFIAAKLIPPWITAMVLFVAGLGAGRLLFGIPLRGPVWVVILGAGVYLTVALGIGLFVSTITRTQQQTMFVSFFVLMVYLLMSGMFTPLESMPRWAQWVGSATPVRHLVWVMRAVLVRGGGIETAWREIAGLAVAGAAMLVLSARLYQKTSD